ncbi:MAG: alpha/beta hydrolase [bacterium]|nr:alpha/beta hydrolase [bacterium]
MTGLSLLALVACPACHRTQAAPDPIPTHETFRIPSQALGEERVINVHLPPAYLAHPDSPFPVLYMPDGGIGEDFPHIVNTLAELTAAGEVEPLIVVGIENTQRRRDLTGPTEVESDRKIAPVVGGSAAFRAFIRDELMPEVERRYRCAGRTGIVGESAAGLFIMETFCLEPTLFGTYIALSPSLWWNDHALVRGAEESVRRTASLGLTLYLAVANETDIRPPADAFAAVLEQAAPADLAWTYVPRPDLRHGTIYRAESAPAFRTVFAPR